MVDGRSERAAAIPGDGREVSDRLAPGGSRPARPAFSTVSEALANVAKHAGASCARVHIGLGEGVLRIEVVGLPVPQAAAVGPEVVGTGDTEPTAPEPAASGKPDQSVEPVGA